MNYFFLIKVECRDGAFSASTLGQQGEWSRGLNIALENLLNKIVLVGIESKLTRYEQDKKDEANAPGPDTPGSPTLGDTSPAPSAKTRKNKHGA